MFFITGTREVSDLVCKKDAATLTVHIIRIFNQAHPSVLPGHILGYSSSQKYRLWFGPITVPSSKSVNLYLDFQLGSSAQVVSVTSL